MSINIFLTANEAANLLQVTKRAIQKSCKAGKYTIRKVDCNGGERYEIALSSLPETAQKKYLDSMIKSLKIDQKNEPSTVKELYTAAKIEQEKNTALVKVNTALSAKQKQIRDARFHILAAVEAIKKDLHCSQKKAIEALLEQAEKGELSDQLMADMTQTKGKRSGIPSVKTVELWLRSKEQSVELAPKYKQKGGTQPTWLVIFLASYRKPQGLSVMAAYKEMIFDMAAGGFNQEDLPRYDTVSRYIKRLPALVLAVGRKTGSEYSALKSFIRRDWGNVSNQYWVGDGHTFKAKVRHLEHGYAFAPEVTLIIDAASRKIVGWAFSLSENQIAVGEALGNAMIKHGKPLLYYSDNGAGQTAKTIDCPIGGMMSRLGVEHQTGIPGNPQARGIIEGIWDITTIAVAKKFHTFQGTGMDSNTLQKNTRAINSAKTKGEVPQFVPSWYEFMDECIKQFEWYNNKHEHQALGGKTPSQAYLDNLDPLMVLPLTDEEHRDLYRPHVLRTPSRGEVSLYNNKYFSKKLEELPAKTQVRVAYDLNDAQQVWIKDLDGRDICTAEFDGNKVDAFPKTFVDQLKDKRIDGVIRRKEQQIELIKQEKTLIEYQELKTFQIPDELKSEPVAELVRFIPRKQESEEIKQLTFAETQLDIEAKRLEQLKHG